MRSRRFPSRISAASAREEPRSSWRAASLRSSAAMDQVRRPPSQALSRLFGVTPTQRTVRRQDFHLPADQQELQSGATLSIEVFFSFPEIEGLDEDAAEDAVPEFFNQMAASGPGAPLKARMRLQAYMD